MNSRWSAVCDSLPPTQPIDISEIVQTPQESGNGDDPSGDERSRTVRRSGGS